MHYRKAVFFAVAGLLASSGFALADNSPKTSLTLDPTVITADAAADRAPLMGLLDKAGMAKSLDDIGLNIYGWVEAGYTYNHRHHGNESAILPGPFNHEVGNHFMLNQVTLRFEKLVDTKKFDVGGMVEMTYGTDAGFLHSTGMPFNGNDPSDDGNPADPVADKYRANYQYDISQAYLDVSVGGGLKLRIGKFATLLGYETVDPRGNAFYSHSWLFGALPFSATGVLASYDVNDKLSVTAGVTRGWDQTFEDSGPSGGICQIDVLGNVTYKISDQLVAMVNFNCGPQNFNDPGHYRTVINPIVTWALTDKLKLAAEGLYIYDGGLNGSVGNTHAYGDVWGAAVYASYAINDMFTINGRVEKYHSYANTLGAQGDLSGSFGGVPTINVYSFTLGTTITPMPKDPCLKNLSVRPEIRYDLSEDAIFPAHGDTFKDQLTFAADVIFKF